MSFFEGSNDKRFITTNGDRMFAVYMVRNIPGRDTAKWTQIGVAYENEDSSLTLHLDAIPVSGGKINIRPFNRDQYASKENGVSTKTILAGPPPQDEECPI